MRVALGTSKPDTPPRNRTLFQAGFAHKPLIFGLFLSYSAIFAIPDNITAGSHWRWARCRRQRRRTPRASWIAWLTRNADTWFPSTCWNESGSRCLAHTCRSETRKSAWEQDSHPLRNHKQRLHTATEASPREGTRPTGGCRPRALTRRRDS